MNDEVWLTGAFQNIYEESALPCQIVNGKLRVNLTFERFEWLAGDSDDTEAKPYDGDGEPCAIRAHAAGDMYILDITVLSPAAKQLLDLGLVEDVPEDRE